MPRAMLILGMLLLIPYAYMVYFWGFCDDCSVTGDHILYSLALVFALPFILAGYGVYSAVSAGRAMRANLAERQPVRAAMNAGMLWIAVLLAVPALYASWQMYDLAFPDIEEGRDRLGRICEQEGGSTICRPDPANADSTLDAINRINRQQRGL